MQGPCLVFSGADHFMTVSDRQFSNLERRVNEFGERIATVEAQVTPQQRHNWVSFWPAWIPMAALLGAIVTLWIHLDNKISILLGQNNSGKTSALDVVAVLAQTARPQSNSFGLRWSGDLIDLGMNGEHALHNEKGDSLELGIEMSVSPTIPGFHT